MKFDPGQAAIWQPDFFMEKSLCNKMLIYIVLHKTAYTCKKLCFIMKFNLKKQSGFISHCSQLTGDFDEIKRTCKTVNGGNPHNFHCH